MYAAAPDMPQLQELLIDYKLGPRVVHLGRPIKWASSHQWWPVGLGDPWDLGMDYQDIAEGKALAEAGGYPGLVASAHHARSANASICTAPECVGLRPTACLGPKWMLLGAWAAATAGTAGLWIGLRACAGCVMCVPACCAVAALTR